MINSNFICNVIIQVTIIFIFLSVFYFTYAKDKEAEVVTNNIDFLVENILGPGKINFLSNSTRSVLKSNLSNSTISPDAIKADKDVEENNNKIIKKSINTVITILVGVCAIVLFCFMMNRYKILPSFFTNLKFKEIFIETAVIIFFVGLTEFCFLNFFASKFISIEPNKIKTAFLKNIQSYVNN